MIHPDISLCLATGVNTATSPEVLRTIALEGTAAAVWHRALHHDLRAGIEHLTTDQLPAVRTLVAVGSVKSAVLDACKSAGMPDERLAAMLADDVATLAALFSEILAQPLLRLTLDAPGDTDMPRFLMAMERARLFCSYCGRGVQFGPARPDGPPRAFRELAPGPVALFRGFLWRSNQLPCILHRAPLAEHPGERSLLLVIDPVDPVAGHG
jgi:Protein of unknown function (DUF1826)